MKKFFIILFCAIIVDFFYFSSTFSFTNGVNTKLILSVFGLTAFFLNSIRVKEMKISRQMIILTFLATGVSLASLFSMTFNHTEDDAYLSYVISMLVWLAAAYMVVLVLKAAYGKVSIELIADYIIAISFFQCAIAILGNLFVPVNNFIRFFTPWTGWLDSVDRLYGIGDTSALDTGGIRYSIACVLCAYMLVKTGRDRKSLIPWYAFAFIFIAIIGNMIARTTTVGVIMALVYLVFYLFPSVTVSYEKIRTFGWLLAILVIMVGLSVWLYNSNEIIHGHLRFGFEGFFSLVEQGEWDVGSNNTLRSMYVFPETMKTWVIGDGYFVNPSRDPNYLGDITEGYYMNTDVGYLRFIFYFGLVGLIIFSMMIVYSGYICISCFSNSTLLFIMLVLIHFIVWFKVSTDCFFILGFFIALSYVKETYGETDLEELSA